MAALTPPKGPYAGRSVEVKNGNVAEALGRLQYTLQRNRVQLELRLTARHEKKGYKRRRLSSERWRRRFAHEVRKKVQLVNKIRARGA
jgi:ribosomal protein S21